MKPDGGPAYPTFFECGDVNPETSNKIQGYVNPGMTLRDAFAIAAIAVEGGFACRNHESIATECYRLADAMLAQREKS